MRQHRGILPFSIATATGINRNMLSKLYYDRALRADLVDVAQLCEYLNCSVGTY